MLKNKFDNRVVRAMAQRENSVNFNLKRLTIVGWLVLISSVVAGFWAFFALNAWFPPTPGRKGGGIGFFGFAGGIGLFFLAQAFFNLTGVTMIRPKPDKAKQLAEKDDE
jgi:Mg2+ and Co2+ transporter CorA